MTRIDPHLRQRRGARHKRRRQEGIVMLVVLMLIVVATSTGVWAMQSTVYEQKASISFLESSLTRSGAECSAMAGISLEETPGQEGTLDDARRTKYYLPAPSGASRVYTTDFTTPNNGYNCAGDVAMRPAPWQARGFRLHEVMPYADQVSSVSKNSGVQGGRPPQVVVISGYGELGVDRDPLDSNNIRGVHEVISISRAYFDTHD